MIPPGYKDPAKETLANGRSIADIVGARGGKGMPGVIVAPAGIDGRSTNFNPHDRDQVVINIEPDSPNGQALTLTQFKKQSVDRAIAAATQKIPGNDINSIRERTAVAFEELAKIANSGVQNVPAAPSGPSVAAAVSTAAAVTVSPAASQPVYPASPPPVPSTPYTAPENVDRTYSPMAAFGLKKANQTAARTATPTRTASAGPPTKLLYFEKEGIGTVPAFFHDIVVDVDRGEDGFTESGFIVLIYDLNFEQAAARWFPPANDPYKRPWAVQINNDRRLYLVHTTGFQYVYADREFCVLMVEKAVDAEP